MDTLFISFPFLQSPGKTPNHEVMGRKKKLIELDNWDENARMLEEKLQSKLSNLVFVFNNF